MFSAGVGLDASVVERVDAHPRLKARVGEWYYTATAVSVFNRRYLFTPAAVGGRARRRAGDQGVTAIVQNAAPYTYFGNRRVDIGEGATLDSGDLAGVILRAREPDRRPDRALARPVGARPGREPPPRRRRSPA